MLISSKCFVGYLVVSIYFVAARSRVCVENVVTSRLAIARIFCCLLTTLCFSTLNREKSPCPFFFSMLAYLQVMSFPQLNVKLTRLESTVSAL